MNKEYVVTGEFMDGDQSRFKVNVMAESELDAMRIGAAMAHSDYRLINLGAALKEDLYLDRIEELEGKVFGLQALSAFLIVLVLIFVVFS